ncbi:MAG: integration host factor subunit alpha [Deltaproteobacteria bacterium]|nr:integration host factor subunit alpha [Deltaproteobacteria bacterium]
MTKADLVDTLQIKVGFSRKITAEVVDNLIDIIKDTLAAGESVKISGFGNLEVHSKKARRGRNPQSGQEMLITARKVMTFKPGSLLRKAFKNTP